MRAGKTASDSPKPRKRKWIRRGVIVAAVGGLLGLTYYIALPHVVEAYIRSKLSDLGESAGREITFDAFELVSLNKYSFYGFEVSDPLDQSDGTFLSADRVTVRLDRTRLFAGQVVIRNVEIDGPVVQLRDYDDGSSNYGAMWRRVQEALGVAPPPPDEGPDEPPVPSEEPAGPSQTDRLLSEIMGGSLPQVLITDARLDVSQISAEDAPPGLRDLDLEVVSSGQGLACQFTVSAEFDAIEAPLLSRPFQRLELRGAVDPDNALGEIMLGTGEPTEIVDVPGMPDIVVRLTEVGFEYPYTFHVRGLEVLERRTRTPVVSVPELTVALRELTLDPESFFISLVEADGVRLWLTVERNGRTNLDRLLGMSQGPLVQFVPSRLREPRPEVETSPEGTDGAEAPEPSAWALEIDRRKWWEIAPQTTVLTDLRAEVLVEQRDGFRTLDLEIPTLRASKRLLNFQMDVSTEMSLTERNAGSIAEFEAEFVYYYLTDHWGLDLQRSELDIGRFYQIFAYRNRFDLQGGRVTAAMTVNESRRGGVLALDGELALEDFAFNAVALDAAPIEDVDLSYAFTAEIDDDLNLSFSRGDVSLNGLETSVMFDVAALDPGAFYRYVLDFRKDPERRELPDPLPWQSVRLRIDMPRQPVMTVHRAIPSALRGRLEGAEMTGELGWQLDLTASFELDERGRLEVEIPRPEVADVLDEGVELVALPAELDVRRLMEPEFEFTFSDGIGETRRMAVGLQNPRWVPLEQISPAMIQSILNTEDQSFFENQGFNWFQLRVVLADLLAERTLGRGASTISMQLIKNVFLSRERLVSRKLAEMFLTYWLARLVPKELTLETYLNVIEFGPGINGISEAAEHYFGKLPIDLTLTEATFLVSIVPNPRMYHFYWEQGAITDRWWEHMGRYIRIMYRREVITEEEYLAALEDRPEFYLPAEGEPPLRPEEPQEPELPLDVLLPFLEPLPPIEFDVHEQDERRGPRTEP